MSTPSVSGKWQSFGTSIFSVMTQQANAAGAVNLAQGFPDFDGPQVIKDAAVAALKGAYNQYAPSAGLPELRRLLAARQASKSGLSYDWESEVTVFSGATEALFCALQGLFAPGDEIIAFAPFFDCYPAAAHSSGAKIIGVELRAPDFRFDPAEFKRAITPRTKALLINSPHNPTGRVFDDDERRFLRDIAVAHDLVVITDEVYEELVYAPAKHHTLAAMPGMRERTLIISSTAKTFSFTGWKIGYAFGPKALTDVLRTVHQFTVFCSATPLQMGMVAALKLQETYYDDLRRGYLERRDLLVKILLEHGFKAKAPEGTYFVVADYAQRSQLGDLDYALELTTRAKVAAIPVSVFYNDPKEAGQRLRLLRFAFCKGLDTLSSAAANLQLAGAAQAAKARI